MTDRHKTIISDNLATTIAMMFIALAGGIMITAMWFANQPDLPVLDPVDAYCHSMLETLIIFGAPFEVTEAECHQFVLDFNFEEAELTGPLGPGE